MDLIIENIFVSQHFLRFLWDSMDNRAEKVAFPLDEFNGNDNIHVRT